MSDDAKRAYYKALGAFKMACPPIPKNKEVLNKDGKTVRYRFASLGKIEEITKAPLNKNGFTYWWSDDDGGESLLVTCYLNHVDGHQEKSTFPVRLFSGYGTNAAQDGGSANTFGKRYSLSNVLGIVVDEDDDAAAAAAPNSEFLVHHNKIAVEWLAPILQIKDALSGGGDWESAAEIVAEMPMKVWKTLWVAPSNGGFWSTEERHFMKTDEDFKALVHKHRQESGWYDNPENQL